MALTPELRQMGLLAELAVSMRQGAVGLAVVGRGLLEGHLSVRLDTVAVEREVGMLPTGSPVVLAAHQAAAAAAVVAGLV